MNIKLRFTVLLIVLLCGVGVFARQLEPGAAQKSKKTEAATTGKIEALVILIEFADRTAYFSRNEVDSFFNQVGFNKFHDNGSVRDYWAAVSQNRIDVHTNVSEAYYKAPKNFAYYDTDGGTGHTHELLDSALNWLDKQGFDFSKLTVDANNNIKALSFQFVGNSGASGLWGHSSYHGRTFDGVNTASYQISELGTTEMHLGGICHEQGHMLFGWPDTYDIDASNGGSSGCGKFDLMAAGNSDNTGAPSGNPMPPNPYFRYLAGWNDLIPMNRFPNDTIIKIIANSANTYVYRNPDKAGEMYIVEARKKPYRNVDMPGEGILVWHIDSVIPNNANQQHTELQHYKVSVVQADNRYELEAGTNIGDANDYFKLGNVAAVTYLRTSWWNSAYSGLQLRNIRSVSDTMAVSFGSANATDVGITSTRTLGGAISPFGLKYYTKNSSGTYIATPLKGFDVADCLVDGLSQGAISTYTFTELAASHKIDFSFIHKAVNLKDVSSVVNYSYYEGAWTSVPDFSKLIPIKTGKLLSLTLTIAGRASDNFGVHYSGFIKAPTDGEYTFYLTSDDGSKFLIDGIEIVSNQCEPEKSGKIKLKAGYHAFTLDFFEGQITESLSLKWSGPGLTKRVLTGIVTGTIDESTAVENITDISGAKMCVTSDEFKFTCPDTESIQVEIYSLSGQLVERQALNTTLGIATLPVTNLKSGLYIVRVSNSGKVLIRQKVSVLHSN
ncbi:MAG: M6 family metalloprotease domain-containing protein [Paludibacter sp.]|nr:M6 family metalloprotease domain-containing protein [Paludibacter sp.]